MAVLRWIITLPVIIICVVIALSNRQDVEFTYSPFHEPITLDLYFIILCGLAAGFFLGSVLTWFSSAPVRKDRRVLKKEVKTLQKTLDMQSPDGIEEVTPPAQSGDIKQIRDI